MIKEVVIVGGGPAGLALAAGLSLSAEISVTVIEKSRYERIFAGEHLQADVVPLFGALGLPQSILLDHSTLCDGVEGFWGGDRLSRPTFFNPYGPDFILHRPAFEQAVARELAARGVSFVLGTTDARLRDGELSVAGKRRAADLIFDCSGRTSLAFTTRRLIFDRLLGVSFHTTGESSVETARIVVESTANGWWYQSAHRYGTVTTFFTDAPAWRELAGNLATETRGLQKISGVGRLLGEKPVVRPAFTSLQRDIPNSVLPVGDALFSLDPLSSQGIMKAFSQASELASIVRGGANPGELAAFYTRQRKAFFESLLMRERFYERTARFHRSEFHRRRLNLGLTARPDRVKSAAEK